MKIARNWAWTRTGLLPAADLLAGIRPVWRTVATQSPHYKQPQPTTNNIAQMETHTLPPRQREKPDSYLYQFADKLVLWVIPAFLFANAGHVHAFPLPAIPNVFNVSDYGATGDGTTDDTIAIQAAVNAARAVLAPLVYLPDGTYRVRDTIQLCATGAGNEWMTLQGESMTGTVIRLADSSSGFGDPVNPKAVVLATPGSGATFQHQSVIDLTINTGSNNPGVIALDQHSNNVGASENLLLKSADANGHLGFAFRRGFGGTHFVKKVEVDGFSTGVDLAIGTGAKSNILLEHIVVRNADIGVYCHRRCVGIRDLQTFNVAQPVYNQNETNLAIIDSIFNHDGASGSCGINFNHASGHLFVRNVTANGFDAVVADNGAPTGGTRIDEWHTGSKVKLWDHAPDTTLNLPIQETPDLAWDLSNSVIVDCQAQDYDSDVIQDAIDHSGKEIVILSGVDAASNNMGRVKLDKSIYVRGGVRRIYGSKMEAAFDDPNDPRYAFIIETGDWPVVSIDTFRTVVGGIRNQSSKTVVLRELRLWHSKTCYETASETPGDLFWEHVMPAGKNQHPLPGPQVIFRDQRVWSRGLNMIGVSDQLHAYNSDVWLFGINTGELHPETWLAAHPGSRLEVFSAFMDGGPPENAPSSGMIKSYGGDISVASCGVYRQKETPLGMLLWEQLDWEGNGGEILTKSLLELPISPRYCDMPFYRAAAGHVCRHGELLMNGNMSSASYAIGGNDAQFQDLDQGWVVALPDNLDLTTNPGKMTWDGMPTDRLADSLAQINSVADITGNTLVLSFDWTPAAGSLHPTLSYSLIGWKRTGSPAATSDFLNGMNGAGHSASGLDGHADAIDLLMGVNSGSGDSDMSVGSATGTAGSNTHHVVSIDMSNWGVGLNNIADYDYIGIRFKIPGDPDLTAIGSTLDNVSFSVFSRSCGWCDFVNDYGLIGLPTNDSDSDGESDLYEFALGGNPTNGMSRAMVPWFTRHPDGSVSYHYWQVNQADPCIAYVAEWSDNLTTWFSAWGSTVNSATTNPAYNGVEHRISGQTHPQLFFRLKIIK